MVRLLPVLLLTACGAKLDYSDVLLPDDGTFGTAEPTDDERARYDDAVAYAEAHGSVELLVVRGTDVVYHWVAPGRDPASSHHLFSGTKSFSCALAAVLEGDLDLDAPVADTLPDLAAGPDVTARHLLHFTSGIEQRFWALSGDGMRAEQHIEDKYAYAVALDGQWEPGSRFQYGSSHLMVFGALVKAQTGSDPLEVLDERVFAPIGLSYGGWHHDPAGNAMLPYGAWTTALEWAEYGVLIRDDGMWQGERVLPEGVREKCATGSAANPAYGLTWWLNAPLADDADTQRIGSIEQDGEPILYPGGYPDAFVAAGHGNQRLYVVPSLDLVVVLISDGDRAFRDRELVERLLPRP